MKITDILQTETIAIDVIANNKTDLLNKLIVLASKSNKITSIEKVCEQVIAREQLMTTGIGNGVALPHAKTNFINGMAISLAILKNPIDFDSIDAKPVSLALLLLGREKGVGSYLRLLSKISKMIMDNESKNKILNCRTEKEVFELFVETWNNMEE